MNKKQLERRTYVKPECAIIPTETEAFICTSVTPKTPESTEADWNNEIDITGGDVDFEQDN